MAEKDIAATPMMRQFLDLKAGQHRDAWLLGQGTDASSGLLQYLFRPYIVNIVYFVIIMRR